MKELRTFFKTVGVLLHLITVHPKLIFLGALEKALKVPEDRSYQIQYFTKIFANPLALTLHACKDFCELNDLSSLIDKPTCYKNFGKPTYALT